MARYADHDVRQAELADAALAIGSEAGLDAVTVARVARRAGYSVGLVQHYFSTKQALMVQAYRRTLTLALDRVDETLLREEAARRSIREMLPGAVAHLLPLDERRRRECAVRTQFTARAVVDADLAAVATQARVKLLSRLRLAVDNGRECGETAATVDTDAAVWELYTLVDGGASVLLADREVPVPRLVEAAAARIFPGPCSRSVARQGYGPRDLA